LSHEAFATMRLDAIHREPDESVREEWRAASAA
jgi:hypothetical protein